MRMELKNTDDVEKLERIARELAFEYLINGHVTIGMDRKVYFVIDRIERKQPVSR